MKIASLKSLKFFKLWIFKKFFKDLKYLGV